MIRPGWYGFRPTSLLALPRMHRALDTATQKGTSQAPGDAAQPVGISFATCAAVLRVTVPPVSIDATDPDPSTLMEIMADPSSPCGEDAAQFEGLRGRGADPPQRAAGTRTRCDLQALRIRRSAGYLGQDRY
jgi:hypothetical protein